jgi:hypothetical protein
LPVFVDPEDDRGGLAQERLCQAREHGSVLGLVPLYGKLVGGPDDQTALVEGYGLSGLEPRANRVVGKFAMRFVENALPGVFGGQLHRYSKRREFFPGREMLRVRYKNVNRDLTGEIGEDVTKSIQGESRTFLSTILHVFNVVHLVNFFPASSAPFIFRPPLGPFT